MGDTITYFMQNHNAQACRECVLMQHGCTEMQVLYTDGACQNNQDHRFRRAGSGIFYEPDHQLNLSTLLPGPEQTNQRAELFAVLVACWRDPRPLDIRSDSTYVCNGVLDIQSGLPSPGDRSGDHRDLWSALAHELQVRTTTVSVSWVLGHAKPIDVERGRTTECDKLGNDGADALAVQGALQHRVSRTVIQDAKRRCEMARDVHRMMLQILQARYAAEQCEEQGADRGSDDEDCFDSEHEEPFAAGSAHASDVVPHDILFTELDTEPFDTELRVSGTEPFNAGTMCTNNLDDEFDVGAAP